MMVRSRDHEVTRAGRGHGGVGIRARRCVGRSRRSVYVTVVHRLGDIFVILQLVAIQHQNLPFFHLQVRPGDSKFMF